MSFQGSGGFRGSGRSRGSRRGFGGRGGYVQEPPESLIPLGYYAYICQEDLVLKVEIEDVPYFNAPIYLENKECIGKIDEIFGNLRDYYVSVKPSDNIRAFSLKKNQKLYIDSRKLLRLKRFLPLPPGTKRGAMGGYRGRGGRGGGRGDSRSGSGGGKRFGRGRRTGGRGIGGFRRSGGGGDFRGGFRKKFGGDFNS